MPAARALLVLLLLAVALAPLSALACPGCKAALASPEGDAGGDLVSGFCWSILFMLSMPMAIVSAFGISIYRATRRQARQAAGTETQPPPRG
jgi:heme/copper-type cytochrome/quinol oxidase subunit 2